MVLILKNNFFYMSAFLFLTASSLIFSFNFDGIKDKSEIKKIRKDNDTLKKKVLEHRKAKDITFKNDDTSPLAGKNRLIVLRDAKYYLNKTGLGFIFSKKKEQNAFFSIMLKKNEWIFDDVANGVKCLNGKAEVNAGEKLHYSSEIKFNKFTLAVYPLEKYLIATLFDLNRKIMKDFNGLKYYPVNEEYYVDAIIEKINNPKKVIMLTSRNLEKTFYKSAKISFKINDKDLSLYAYTSNVNIAEEDILFIPFTDKTTGKESYYSGRYLEIMNPKEKKFKIDFNLAFNPLCNYSPAYNCPIPPSENNLKLKIEAGERTYPVKGH